MSARHRGRTLAASWVALALACAAPAEGSGSPRPTATPSFGPTRVWLAVYDSAADPQGLSAERAQMLSALGDALEGAVVISPAGCLEGLPGTIDAGSYVLALQQDERVYVRALAEQLDGNPRFIGEVTVTCTD